MKMFNIIFTHQAFSVLLFANSRFDIIKSFQRAILKIYTTYIRIFHLHECKTVYLNCNISNRKISLNLLNQTDMGLNEMVHCWRQPARHAFSIAEPRLGILDNLACHKFVSCILRQFSHYHPGFNHAFILLCQALSCFSLAAS